MSLVKITQRKAASIKQSLREKLRKPANEGNTDQSEGREKKTRRDTQEMRHIVNSVVNKSLSLANARARWNCCKQQRPCGGMIMNVMMMMTNDDSVSFFKQALQTPLNCRPCSFRVCFNTRHADDVAVHCM